MRNIKILGMGCPKCKKLTANAEQAVQELGLEAVVEKVTDINDIMKYGIMITPAMVVDGEVKVMGRVPSVEEIKEIIVK